MLAHFSFSSWRSTNLHAVEICQGASRSVAPQHVPSVIPSVISCSPSQLPSPNAMFSLHSFQYGNYIIFVFAAASQPPRREGRGEVSSECLDGCDFFHTCIHLLRACCPHSMSPVFWLSQIYARNAAWKPSRNLSWKASWLLSRSLKVKEDSLSPLIKPRK